MAASGDELAVPTPGGARVDDGDPTVMWLWGEHDPATADSVSSALAEALAVGHREVVVDLADVTFMDASILRPLVRARQAIAARGGHLTVRSPQRSSRRLLEICDLTNLIELAEASPARAALRDQGARTALETWIDVPPVGPATTDERAAVTPPARRDSSVGAPEETRQRLDTPTPSSTGTVRSARDASFPAGSSIQDG